ncbi:MAG TPA: TIGR03617 family F420-dependent LLM class oxidoreductase [Actinomycetota bacterium]|nr:TIGR03617 family F420-dependent LLM class oxidoreductase [Actinomycetota bacterium]
MRIGMVVGGPMQGVGAVAAAIEGAGYDSVWTAETGSDAFIQAAIVAAATTRVRVGTAIALAFPRSPGIAAMTALDLDELSGGRFICGLGSQVKRVNEERFSTPFEHPAPKMRDYILAMRAFIGGHFGESPEHEGRFYRVTMAPWPRMSPPLRRDIPIYLAAVNEQMQRVAGQVADGVVGHPMTSIDYIKQVVLPNIAKGAAAAGRKASDIELAQQVSISISSDRAVALNEVKQQIGFYATTRTYTPVLALHGFDEVVPDLRAAFAEKDMARLAALVSDDMADTFAIYGTPDEVIEKARRFEGVVGELTLGTPWYRVDRVRMLENYQLIMSTFAR